MTESINLYRKLGITADGPDCVMLWDNTDFIIPNAAEEIQGFWRTVFADLCDGSGTTMETGPFTSNSNAYITTRDIRQFDYIQDSAGQKCWLVFAYDVESLFRDTLGLDDDTDIDEYISDSLAFSTYGMHCDLLSDGDCYVLENIENLKKYLDQNIRIPLLETHGGDTVLCEEFGDKIEIA